MKTVCALASCLLLTAGLAIVHPATAASKSWHLTVSAGKTARHHSPVSVPIELPADLADKQLTATLVDGQGQQLVGQVTAPGLLAVREKPTQGTAARELHFILPNLPAGQTLGLTATVSDAPAEANGPAKEAFSWSDDKGKSSELQLAGRPVMRYMYEALDSSSSKRRMETYKPFHHVFDPLGERLVTKGPGGLFPHHRGLFYGFNRITYDGGKKHADVWHCTRGAFQSHEEFLSREAGSVLGRHRVAIDWHGEKGEVFAHEQREMTAYHIPDGVLIQFASRLKTADGPVKLDGDPQHAGFQFRASQEVPDKTKKMTYYLRPDGKDKPGSFRNWPGQRQHANLPWNAMSFVLGEQRYTCCYLDRPENPKESRFSERDYGRFGSYFQYELTDQQPLDLKYRVWLQTGEMTVEQVQTLDDDFVSPVAVDVKSS